MNDPYQQYPWYREDVLREEAEREAKGLSYSPDWWTKMRADPDWMPAMVCRRCRGKGRLYVPVDETSERFDVERCPDCEGHSVRFE